MTPLRQRMTEDMQIRNFSGNTQKSYLQQVSLFARHFRRFPEGLGPANIRDYQLYLTNRYGRQRHARPGSNGDIRLGQSANQHQGDAAGYRAAL
jgi:hypothetical protein